MVIEFFLFSENVNVELFVKETDGHELMSTNYEFFDCSSFKNCTSCTSSPYPCDWCVDNNRCCHDTAENCRNDILVTGLNVRFIILIFKIFKKKAG